MGSVNLDISRFEVSGVYTHPDAKVDVVLVHGLNGDPKKTWTAKNGLYWPTELLPASLKGRHANVLVYGYNADVYSRSNDRGASDNFIFQHAQTLVTHLTTYRKSEGTTGNPIIWLAHSLGGILVKRALLYSNDVRATHHEDFRSIYVSTYGIIFLGTPHTGSGVATWGHVLQSMSDAIVPKRFFESESVLLKTLKRDNERLQEINNHFLDIYQRFKIHMAHENNKTDLKGTKTLVVDADSASPQLPGVVYYGIEATHSGMCKFGSVNAPGYRTVSTAIRDWVDEAPTVIDVRWGIEEEDRQARARHDIDERRIPFITTPPPAAGFSQPRVENNNETALPPNTVPEQDVAPTSPMPLVPIAARPELPSQHESQDNGNAPFLHPEPFRPNSYFVGREKELGELHKKLMDPRRRAEGTSAVLIQCLPGGGKTHLARQYVFRHREDYPGGVYWVRAKSIAEIEQFYWRIARDEALKDAIAETAEEDSQHLCDPRNVVDIVRQWFSENEGWLLVMDGISFLPEAQRFIPDARNSSLIYTSTERAVAGDYEWDNPQIMELPSLSAREAQDLLLLEMEKKQPWTQDDRSRALELVQRMDRLPLMIHVAAQHLKATREPLSRYLRAYKNRPKVGALPAYRAVWDQLRSRGANSALNLMSILVFYDQHIPVGMLSLGLSALDNTTPVLTRDASHRTKSLNNSLKILIAFALIERTESDSASPTSSRSSKTFDRVAEHVDILRIHSIVQAFFIETLAEEKETHFWLERSASVFCRSFDEADRRIREDPKIGLPEDYRRFEIHGRKLLEHLHRHEKKGPEAVSKARKDVEDRFDHIQQAIDQLSQATQTHIVTGNGEAAPASVFERASSLSETDSSTPASHRSLTASDRWVAVGDEEAVEVRSPVDYSDHYGFNPYHWHVPYPHGATIPVPPFQGDGDDDTEAPTPKLDTSWTARPLVPGTPTHSEWDEVGPSHRTLRKNEMRRYHDRGGAWRDQTVGDPRISVSREIAKGSVFRSRGSSGSPAAKQPTAQSDAESTLNKLKKTLPPPPPPRGESLLQDKSRTSSGTFLRPRFMLGRDTYADVLAGETPEAEYTMSPTEFFNGLRTSTSPPSSTTAAILKRLKENILPSRKKSVDQARPAAVPAMATSPRHSSLMSENSPDSSAVIGSPPSPMFRGSTTANSSPGPTQGPFYPPGLPREGNDENGLQRELPATVRQWESRVYHPGRSHLDSSDLGHDMPVDPMALSYPFVGQPHPYAIHVHPPVQGRRVDVDGYTSEPMSRGPSAQSAANKPTGADGATDAVGSSQVLGGGMAAGSPRSSPLGGSPRSLPSVRPTPIPSGEPHARSPSFVETEPSPYTGDAFPGVTTSYNRWEEKHGQGRRRAGSGSLFAGSPVGVRLGRGRGGASRGGQARSQSQSPSGAGRGGGQRSAPLSFRASDASPERSYGGGRAAAAAEGGEPMARSGSGGIKLADGRIVEFGQVAVDVEPVGARSGHGSPGEDGGVGLGILD